MRFLVIVLLAAALPAQTLREAEQLWQAHDYKAANDVFRALDGRNPKNADYKVRWGRMLLERFNRADAASLFKEALQIDPHNPGALLGLGLIAADNFDNSASEFAHKALEADPNLTEAQELLARVALEDNNPKLAREEAGRALELDPKSIHAEAVLAAADLLERADAGPWLTRIAAEHPRDGRGYETIGYFLQVNRRYEDGIGYFRKAIDVEPQLWSAHSQLGVNLMRLAREDEARKELELCFRNGYDSDATVNTLRLMDTYKDFKTFRTPATILRLNEKEAAELRLYIEPEMQRALATYEKKYEFKLPRPVQLEVYPNHEDFAVRTMGMPGLGALGVTFQDVVAMDSPSGRPPGSFHWAGTMWHEFSHVYVLTITKSRVPRWFTEGLAVHEETQPSPDWGDRLTPDVVMAIKEKKLLPVAELDRGFIHPTYPGQVVISYYQAGKICDFISKQWGEHKLLDIVHAFATNDSTPQVLEQQLGIKTEEFDKRFLSDLASQTKGVVDGIDEWKKDIRIVNAAVAAKKWDEVAAKAPPARDEFPEYVEDGSAYEALAALYKSKGDSAKETDSLTRYSEKGGRNPEAIKRLGELLSAQGKTKASAAALERLIYIAPLDSQLHAMLGERLLALSEPAEAAREYRALIAGKTQDPAAAHFGLARALRLEHRDAEAKDELLESLEAAPDYKPAQKLLLEMTPASE